MGGGAYGFYASVSLFGGPAVTRGPTPTVQLPAGGLDTPVTASDPSGLARFGPATIFSSDTLDVSTRGTAAASASVTSSATIHNVDKSGEEAFTASTLGSTCAASATDVSGSTTVEGGKLTVSQGADPDSHADDVVVPVPLHPGVNTSYDGKIENVGDSFRVVFNEQTTAGDAITVNAMHMYLLGPIAVGDVIVGQSRCTITSAAVDSALGRSGSTPGRGSDVAKTGTEIARTTAVALDLVVVGSILTRWAGQRRVRAHRQVAGR
jgi:hypothetical protein